MPRNRKKQPSGGLPHDKGDPLDDESEVYEKVLQRLIDGTSHKSQQSRVSAYHKIYGCLVQRYSPISLTERKVMLLESLKRSLGKGNEEEQIWAARVIPLLAIQTETSEDVAALLKMVRPTMMDAMKGINSETSNVRAMCCTGLAMLSFISENDTEEIMSVMQHLQAIAQREKPGEDNGGLQAVVLRCWSLLLSVLPSKMILKHMKSGNILSPRNIIELLDSTHLEVRIVSGETIALMHELFHQHDPTLLQHDLPSLLDTVRKLSTDAYRFQAKQGRKLQRITFRDVLHYLQQNVVPLLRIKVGDETLLLHSWTMHVHYSAVKEMLGPALNIHLKDNPLIRDILKMDPKRMESACAKRPAGRMTKKAEQRSNRATSKERSIRRGKERDN
uniref:Interferon-related developmental regulator N-terminal domain-containing protein n=1 Tax=Anopheles epiroticus TaxID=199890 RepID=A0A182PW68_9DIPT